ncbi:LapA family protein [Nocardioides panaciterrulae]|uniref:Putative integral membrane protein n=1 Tax=Nocardioides panaciterrulae TaxID=661492 RepID=A0A7Y9E5L9_9ACTN|nr:LapA family protein [Nocardioides panaciterrulae]NYD41580.1 putative integral membrane protein [Nocardioides panaciterrulae]
MSENPTPPSHEPAGPSADAARGPEAPATPAAPGKDPLRGSRTSGFWAAVIGLGLVLILLVIFIAQNTQDVSVSFLAWSGTAPLAVSLLIATIAGLFLAGVAGSLRILQLRRRVRREKRR